MANVLLVDDSQMVRKKLRLALESKGHTVVEASDGLEGLSKIEENSGFQIIIADVNMPNMNGVDMCVRLRQDKKNLNIKIFILSAEGSPDMKLKAKDANIRAWIMKPYDTEKLLMAIEKTLSE